jgi:Surface-adhesin protein E
MNLVPKEKHLMRSLLPVVVITFLVLIPLLSFLPRNAAATEPTWILTDENAGTRFYYDKTGISMPRPGISRVPIRVVYTEEGKAEALDVLEHDPGFAKLFETLYSYDLDCQKRRIHLLNVTHLDDDGKQLKAVNMSAVTEWEDIPPDSRLDLLADEVCPK